MSSDPNHVCSVCSADFEVISDLVDADEQSVQFCPFCGSEIEDQLDIEELLYDEDEDHRD
jgi:predicted amidophosphoribosyltransferase